MKKIVLLLLVTFLLNVRFVSADEGMWIPLLIEKYNIEDMQKKGFKLSAEDIYSINQDCLKDAIVIFGRGCTGELVSNQGLILTNHHCGYGAIQQHSSVEHDYLTDGFWAMSQEEELPNPGLTATFLKRIEDVTEEALEGVTGDMTEEERKEKIRENSKKIQARAEEDNHYNASVRSFYYGNQYFLFVYEVYKDVRLVGAPPSAIGKFGGDTDNWMWPRHTGDFSVFRIYADTNNQPAEYSSDNVPYKPKKHLPISIKGINEGDFTMVLGYPGSTYQYVTSDEIKWIKNVSNPNKIELRDIRLDIMNKYMNNNDTIRIKYASKNAGVSNSWKRWKGEIIGLERLNAVEKKMDLEYRFRKWAESGHDEYIGLLEDFSNVYSELEKYEVAYDYYREAILALEIVRFASRFDHLIELIEKEADKEDITKELEYLQQQMDGFYKDYVQKIDQEIFYQLLPLYYSNVSIEFHPDLSELNFSGDYEKFAKNLYQNSIFDDQKELSDFLSVDKIDELISLKNDAVYEFYQHFNHVYQSEIKPKRDSLNNITQTLYRSYMKGLMEMQDDKILFPDANFTMRVSYGDIKGSYPRDGIKYQYYTTLDGVMEKDNPEIYDYDVPERLKEIYRKKDFGKYEVDGSVPVCFLATNHTTGGNSGSPVLDAEGNLIGLNFDRVWEGIMSDMIFDPKQSRNISVDIRYVLFLIDKYAGATHLIDEMTIVE
ncbi:MAG TPA: S46 family peptidase [Bacteroidales bacterium]|nr:S46 family peptidase [Bacteroidales bacterium]